MSKNNARLRGFWAPPAPQPGLVLAAQISSPGQMVGVMESTSLLCKEARQAHTGSFPNRSGALGQPPSHQAALTSHSAHPNPRTQAGPSVLASHQPHHSKNTSHALISSSLTQVETNSNCLQRTELNAWAGGSWGEDQGLLQGPGTQHRTQTTTASAPHLQASPSRAGSGSGCALQDPWEEQGPQQSSRGTGCPGIPSLSPAPRCCTAPGLLSPREMPCMAPASPLISALLPRKAQRARDRNFPSSISELKFSE